MTDLSVTTIQTNIYWEDKEANLIMLEEKICSLHQQTQIIILPEMFNTGFSMNAAALAEDMNGPTIHWMKKISKENNVILTGSIIIKEDNVFYNRLIWMMPNQQMGFYDKRHLFGFAKEDQFYERGDKRLITSVNGWKINLQICYDLRFPVWARQQSNETSIAEYDILINVANWPEKRNHAWETLLMARAIENQCYVIGVNRVGKDANNQNYIGNSCIINPLGETLYKKSEEEDIHHTIFKKDDLLNIRSSYPFLRDRDHFMIH
jgi:predicted amidohydrolase